MKESTLNKDIKRNLEQLETTRDEVRVRLHLAQMDVRKAWDELEPELLRVESAAKTAATEATHALLTDAIKKLIALRGKLPKGPAHAAG